MLYNVFDTESEAVAAQEYDFVKFMEVYSDNNGYDHSTNHWDNPRQRVSDGKWVYLACPESDAVYTTEQSEDGWFTDEE